MTVIHFDFFSLGIAFKKLIFWKYKYCVRYFSIVCLYMKLRWKTFNSRAQSHLIFIFAFNKSSSGLGQTAGCRNSQ
jgi:hypothetical protein